MTTPDYVLRTWRTPGQANLPNTDNQVKGLSQDQADLFNAWNSNVAGKDGLAAGTVPVSGAGVTGTVSADSVTVTPASSVAVSTTNMLVAQNFTAADTVVADNNWSWDGTDGDITLGCARVDCDGFQSDLVSNEIAVVTGETIETSCQVKWENIVYTGSDPITLGVEKYRRSIDPDTGGVTYLDIGGVDVASVGVTPAANGAWGAGDIAGNYVVEAGVDQLRFRFRASTSITSGTVKWDEANFLKLDLIEDAAVPGVGETVDDIVRRLFGADGEGFTHNDAAVALGNTAAALLSMNARVSALEAANSAGAIAGDDFLWSGEITASANWGGGYSQAQPANGYYAANGTDAIWHTSGFTPFDTTQECWFDWQGTGATSTTDYQLVQLVLSSPPSPAAGYQAFVYLHGRVNSGWTQYIRAIFGSNGTYSIGYVNGGAFQVMNSGTCAVPGSGSLLSLYCGDKANTLPRHYKLTVNNTIIADFNEVGTGSALGSSNRKWGWGGKAQGGLYFAIITFAPTQATPPKVNQWLGYDQ